MQDQGTLDTRGPRDDRTIKPGAGVQIVRPSWDGHFPLVAKLLPNFSPDNPEQVDPWRLDSTPRNFSDWVRVVPIAKYIGIDTKLTFIAYDPRKKRDEGYDDRTMNPYVVLLYAVEQAVQNGEAMIGHRRLDISEWASLSASGKNRKKKAFDWVKSTYMFQGVVYQNGDKVYVKGGQPPLGVRDRDKPVIIQATGTAGRGLEELLEEKVEGYRGSTSDLEAMYVHGDILTINGGKLVCIYNDRVHDPSSVEAAQVQETVEEQEEEPARGGSGGGGGGGDREFAKWSVTLMDQLRYLTVQGTERRVYPKNPDLTNYWDRLRIQWWDDVLHFPETEELCVMLASAFRSRRALLDFGWQDNPDFFTSDVNGILAFRTQGPGAEIPGDDGQGPAGPRRSAAIGQPYEEAPYEEGGGQAVGYDETAYDDGAAYYDQTQDETYQAAPDDQTQYYEEPPQGDGQYYEEVPQGEVYDQAQYYEEGAVEYQPEAYEEAPQEEPYVADVEEGVAYEEGEDSQAFIDGQQSMDNSFHESQQRAQQRSGVRAPAGSPAPQRPAPQRQAPQQQRTAPPPQQPQQPIRVRRPVQQQQPAPQPQPQQPIRVRRPVQQPPQQQQPAPQQPRPRIRRPSGQ